MYRGGTEERSDTGGYRPVSYTHLDVYKRQADYQGKIAVYYNPAKMSGTKQVGAESMEYTCGILLEQEDCMIGIPCADIGAQEEFLDDLMPVINGVGEKRCD